MDKVIAAIIGVVCGGGQFFLLRYTLKPLAEGKNLKVGLLMFLKFPIPLVFLVGCALINPDLLPFAGGAFCLSLVAASVINNLVTLKKRRDDI